MATKKTNVPEPQLGACVAAHAGLDVEVKVRPDSAYTSIGERMATTISAAGLMGVRLAEDEIVAWMAEHGVERYRSKPEFPLAKVLVDVPPLVWQGPARLRSVVERAVAHTASLAPKPGA